MSLRIEPTQGAQGRSPLQPGFPGAPVLLGPLRHTHVLGSLWALRVVVVVSWLCTVVVGLVV